MSSQLFYFSTLYAKVECLGKQCFLLCQNTNYLFYTRVNCTGEKLYMYPT
uniref:Uncharacterized protein n=1 Tax=Arundo donax TaxID=35708 RepID=A0A0A8Y6G0_ARUDO